MEWYWSLAILLFVMLVLWGALTVNAKATEVPEPTDKQHAEHAQSATPDVPAQG
jgi:hypothetical protein